jgi:tRNA A37 N6-isopentenylltransferase MiaA
LAREKYDWDKIKVKYLSGSYKNLRDFAEKEKINYDVLRRKASKWQVEKSQANHTKVTKIVTKTIEKIAEKEADRNARFLSMSDLAADAIEEYLKQKHYKKHVVKYKYYDCEGKPDSEQLEAVELDVADTKALSNIVSSLDKIQKGQRLALGLDKKDDDKDKGGQIIVVHNIPRPPKE